MADSWTCSNCKAELRCSCQSMECSFDYDIRAHVRKDLNKALELALAWYPANEVINLVEVYVSESKEPCCQACVDN
jgi:L-rhamnose isomerase